jgi:GNAT superfamily N-acetyltransferase
VTAPEVTLEPASESDFEELAALRVEAMRESLEHLGRFDPIRARERLRSGFDPGFTRHVIVGGARIGFVVVKPIDGDLVLDHLYIAPSHQQHGYGGAVLAQVIRESEALGLALRVGALRGSRSNAFYLRHGFVQSGEGEWDVYYTRQPNAEGVPETGGRA